MIKEMGATQQHTPESWCDIMHRAASRCITDDDQHDFIRYMLNPDESWDIPDPTFLKVDPNQDVLINEIERMTITEDDEKQSEKIIMHRNQVKTVGGKTYIVSTPIKCTSLQ